MDSHAISVTMLITIFLDKTILVFATKLTTLLMVEPHAFVKQVIMNKLMHVFSVQGDVLNVQVTLTVQHVIQTNR